MMKIRENIIHRKLRHRRHDNCNEANIDKEYQQQQEKLAKCRGRREALIGERRRNMFATREEKAEMVGELVEARERLDRARHEQDMILAKRDSWLMKDAEQHDALEAEVEDMEIVARKSYMRNLCQENLKLAEYRRRLQQEAAEKDKERERGALNFYDRWGRNAFT